MAVVAEDRRTDEQRRGEENGCCVPAVQMSVTNAMPTPVVSQTVTSSKHGQFIFPARPGCFHRRNCNFCYQLQKWIHSQYSHVCRCNISTCKVEISWKQIVMRQDWPRPLGLDGHRERCYAYALRSDAQLFRRRQTTNGATAPTLFGPSSSLSLLSLIPFSVLF